MTDYLSFDTQMEIITTMVDGGSGTLKLAAADDDYGADDESLTLNDMVGDAATGSVTVTIWNAAAPTAPLGGLLLPSAPAGVPGHRRRPPHLYTIRVLGPAAVERSRAAFRLVCA